MAEFCRHLTNALAYNNNTYEFTISPCCYFTPHSAIQSTDFDLPDYRKTWQNSDLKKSCAICLQMEQSGVYSYRQASFDILEGKNDNLEMLTVAINKQCNLACPSCDSDSSSFWYQENIRNNIKQPSNIIKLHQEDKQGVIKDKFLEALSKQDLSNLRYIKFGGGEPLMSNIHVEVLDLIKNPENVTLQYTSNLSIMPTERALKSWEKFKLVKWVGSIDGVGERFTFLRWPYNWEKLNSFVKTAVSAVPYNVMFGVEHTLNPLNIFYFDEFEKWFDEHIKTNKVGDQSDLNLHLCWGDLDISRTPPELRSVIKEKYKSTHPIVKLLDDVPISAESSKLVNYLDILDKQRNQDWRSTFSDVEGYFNV